MSSFILTKYSLGMKTSVLYRATERGMLSNTKNNLDKYPKESLKKIVQEKL